MFALKVILPLANVHFFFKIVTQGLGRLSLVQYWEAVLPTELLWCSMHEIDMGFPKTVWQHPVAVATHGAISKSLCAYAWTGNQEHWVPVW